MEAAEVVSTTTLISSAEIWLLVIGAAIGFVASVGAILIERMVDSCGKVKLYYVLVGGREKHRSYGFSIAQNGDLVFVVPMIIEIQNTSRTARVTRDVCLELYNNGVKVADMLQIFMTGNEVKKNGITTRTESTDYGTDKNSYSFVIEPRSIQRQLCSFMYSIPDKEKDSETFDEVKLRYFDEHDKKRVFSIRKIDKCWVPAQFHGDDDWQLIK